MRLTAVRLAVNTGLGVDDGDGMDLFARVELPPLAAIHNLTGLVVQEGAVLPPDWRSLPSLQCLEVHSVAQDMADWGQPLTGLGSLTHLGWAWSGLCGDRLPATLCDLTALRSLVVCCAGACGGRNLKVPVDFTRLAQHTRLEINGKLGGVPEPVQALTSLQDFSLESNALATLAAGPYLQGLTRLEVAQYSGSRVPRSLASATALKELHIRLPTRLPKEDVLFLAGLPTWPASPPRATLKITYRRGEDHEWSGLFRSKQHYVRWINVWENE